MKFLFCTRCGTFVPHIEDHCLRCYEFTKSQLKRIIKILNEHDGKPLSLFEES